MILIILLLILNAVILSAVFTGIAHIHEHHQYLEDQLEIKAKK